MTKHAETSGTKKGLGVATLNIYLCSAEPANVTIFATSSLFDTLADTLAERVTFTYVDSAMLVSTRRRARRSIPAPSVLLAEQSPLAVVSSPGILPHAESLGIPRPHLQRLIDARDTLGRVSARPSRAYPEGFGDVRDRTAAVRPYAQTFASPCVDMPNAMSTYSGYTSPRSPR